MGPSLGSTAQSSTSPPLVSSFKADLNQYGTESDRLLLSKAHKVATEVQIPDVDVDWVRSKYERLTERQSDSRQQVTSIATTVLRSRWCRFASDGIQPHNLKSSVTLDLTRRLAIVPFARVPETVRILAPELYLFLDPHPFYTEEHRRSILKRKFFSYEVIGQMTVC
ncbi:hypothetical protein BDV97DRAFT_49370 [Delphinella strobiligena]|nr:hypothetical protein BDV97DRAFT_49370 [Delphinella strobiligena]